MAGEIPVHSFPIPVILACVQFVGSPVLVLLVPVIPKMNLASFSRLSVPHVRRVLFESRSSLESENLFFH